MCTSGAVVSYRRRHSFRYVFVYYGHRQKTVLAFPYPFRRFHNEVTMETVYDFVLVFVGKIVADARHCVAVLPDGTFQQFHLRRRHNVRVVVVCHHFLYRNGDNIVHRAFKRFVHFSAICIFSLPYLFCLSPALSAKSPCIGRYGRF